MEFPFPFLLMLSQWKGEFSFRMKKENFINGEMRRYVGVNENMGLDVRRTVALLLECELLGLTHTG